MHRHNSQTGGLALSARKFLWLQLVVLLITFTDPTEALLTGPENTSAIPIFPLRKRVLLPSERIVLNLYEERYLLLAERFLEADIDRIIGAFPSTGKPQIIVRGLGPIIPLLEPGDCGVICTVEKAEEAQIPTVGGSLRRRIRLECKATRRVELTRIVSRGTTPPDAMGSERIEASSLPYITAEYRLQPPLDMSLSSSGHDTIGTAEDECSMDKAISKEFLAFKEYLRRNGDALSKLDRLKLLQSGISSAT